MHITLVSGMCPVRVQTGGVDAKPAKIDPTAVRS